MSIVAAYVIAIVAPLVWWWVRSEHPIEKRGLEAMIVFRLAQSGGWLTAEDLTKLIGFPRGRVRRALERLEARKEVDAQPGIEGREYRTNHPFLKVRPLVPRSPGFAGSIETR